MSEILTPSFAVFKRLGELSSGYSGAERLGAVQLPAANVRGRGQVVSSLHFRVTHPGLGVHTTY